MPPKNSPRKKDSVKVFPDLPPPDGFPDIESLKMGCFDFKIRWMSDSERDILGIYGLCDRDKHIISIAQSMHPLQMAEVFAHESLHAAYFTMGLKERSAKEEDVVQAFGTALAMIVRDNDELVAWWLSLFQ